MSDVPPRTQPRIVYLVSEDWYFLSHRLPMARAARAAGYEVHVATHLNGEGARIEAEGFHLHALDWRRGSFNPLNIISIVRQVRSLYRALQPDLVHHVALQPSIIGSLAALGMPFPRLNALAGLGFGFTSATLKGKVLRPLLSAVLRFLFRRPEAAVLVQNPDDRSAMMSLGIVPDRIFMVRGSGVDTERLKPLPEPAGPVTAAFVGRLLDDKGVRTLIEAHALLNKRGEDIRLLIAGDRDPANPTSIGEDEIESWKKQPEPRGAGFCRRHRQGLGAGAYRRPAVTTGGAAAEPPGSRSLRARHCGNRRARAAARSRGRASTPCWCRRTMRWPWRTRSRRSPATGN